MIHFAVIFDAYKAQSRQPKKKIQKKSRLCPLWTSMEPKREFCQESGLQQVYFLRLWFMLTYKCAMMRSVCNGEKS